MRIVAGVVGIGVADLGNEIDDCLDEFMDESDLAMDLDIQGSEVDGVRRTDRVRFGWPGLQAEVLREIIDIAEVTEGKLCFFNSYQTIQTSSFSLHGY
jgi:hypothetical protein